MENGNKKHEKIIQVNLNEWNDIFRLTPFLRSDFIYRGQNNDKWVLTTAIERLLKVKSHSTYDYCSVENDMIIEFHKRHRLYSKMDVDFKDISDLLSIMQHHGAATRLLDFTKSIYIAAYFAIIENSSSNKNNAVIWAVNKKILERNYTEKISEDYNSFADKVISESVQTSINRYNRIKTVIPFEPLLSGYTERLSKQQGLFLMPTNSAFTFMDNLYSAFKVDFLETEKVRFNQLLEMLYYNEEVYIFKLVIPKKIYSHIAEDLKEMNINAEILFPGLDGLAKSINNKTIEAFSPCR